MSTVKWANRPQKSLSALNKRIYQGKCLESDHLRLEELIFQAQDRSFFADDNNPDWVCLEGKPFKQFLHLEDTKSYNVIEKLKNRNKDVYTDTDSILNILYDFYSDLYVEQTEALLQDQIQEMLNGIPSIPILSGDMSGLTAQITLEEEENAIKKLWVGKSPGGDGLTADFYKHFSTHLCGLLSIVFNDALKMGILSPSQRLAIIILLFKKGDKTDISNYRPISLTNCDYKILAYIFSLCLEPYLTGIIHENQTAYMKEWFIGTNIHSVQDILN